jgi:DNA-binding response OmpR family regulator
MLQLRRKLEDNLDEPKYFQTESGIGYRFHREPADGG